MKKEPKVTVVVPVYKAEPYIEKCVRSLFRQTMMDMEYVFVDDASPDRSVQMIENLLEWEFQERKSQVRIIRLSQNGGVANARNVGVSEAIGEFVIHADSDDWVDEEMYASLYDQAKETGADIVGCDFVREFPDGSTTLFKQNYADTKEECFSRLLTGSIFPSLCFSIVRRSLYADHHITFPKNLNMGEDLAVNVCLYTYARNISYLPRPYYHYRMNPESLCGARTLKSVESDVAVAAFIEQFLHKVHLSNYYAEEIACRKFFSKLPLWADTRFRDYKRWRTIYPESHRFICRYPRLDWKMKLEYSLAAYGMPGLADAFVKLLQWKSRCNRS